MGGDSSKSAPDKKNTKEPEEIQMDPEWAGRGPPPKELDKGAGARDPKAPETAAAIDFTELDEAFENVATEHRGIVNRQQIAVREVLGNLNEADSPSIGEEILKTLAVTALGYASGGISAAIAGKLTTEAEQVMNNAIQTALDDGFKEAVGVAVGRMSAGGANSSKATFFASQEEALETSRSGGEREISKKKKEAKQSVSSAPADQQAGKLSQKLGEARKLAAARSKSAETARQLQYKESLSAWMTAMAQDSLGKNGSGTKLDDAMDISPKNHFNKRGETGVIYIAFGQKPASRPITPNNIKVAGMTDAARQRIKDVPIKDLKMPVIATGFLYDGALDALSISMLGDNELSIGRTEDGAVSTWGHADARSALKKAANATSETEAARIILEQDLGKATLADARMS